VGLELTICLPHNELGGMNRRVLPSIARVLGGNPEFLCSGRDERQNKEEKEAWGGGTCGNEGAGRSLETLREGHQRALFSKALDFILALGY